MGMLLAAAFLADRLGAAHILGAAMVVLGLSMLWRLLPDPFDSGALIGDLLFILARVANLRIGGDVLWQPCGGRQDAPGTEGHGADEKAEGAD